VFESFNEGFVLGDVASLNPSDLSPYGLDEPMLDFFIDMGFGEVVHLLFGDTFTFDANGFGVPCIYVKFADRPHVFMAQLDAVNYLMDLNVVRFVFNQILVVPIVEVEWLEVTHATMPERNMDMIINHAPANNIEPTINDVLIDAQTFRNLYRILITLRVDSVVTPFYAEVEPEVVITYHMLDGSQTKIEFFPFDGNFYAFSVDGEEIWAVTNRRVIDIFFTEALNLKSQAQ
jgi:hypothetical protein